MDYVVLDLGSDVNVLMKKTWESMGKLKLIYSPIQLSLANQQMVIPYGRLEDLSIDIDGVRTLADFEVIEIVDGTNHFPALLGIDWAMDNHAIINVKKRLMTFEDNKIRVIAPLDPEDGPRYIEPIREEDESKELENIYKVTARQQDYINPTVDGKLSWRSISSCTSESDEALENWQTRLHEVSMCRCARTTKSLR